MHTPSNRAAWLASLLCWALSATGCCWTCQHMHVCGDTPHSTRLAGRLLCAVLRCAVIPSCSAAVTRVLLGAAIHVCVFGPLRCVWPREPAPYHCSCHGRTERTGVCAGTACRQCLWLCGPVFDQGLCHPVQRCSQQHQWHMRDACCTVAHGGSCTVTAAWLATAGVAVCAPLFAGALHCSCY